MFNFQLLLDRSRETSKRDTKWQYSRVFARTPAIGAKSKFDLSQFYRNLAHTKISILGTDPFMSTLVLARPAKTMQNPLSQDDEHSAATIDKLLLTSITTYDAVLLGS